MVNFNKSFGYFGCILASSVPAATSADTVVTVGFVVGLAAGVCVLLGILVLVLIRLVVKGNGRVRCVCV